MNTELNRKLSETDKKKQKLASELAELQKQVYRTIINLYHCYGVAMELYT